MLNIILKRSRKAAENAAFLIFISMKIYIKDNYSSNYYYLTEDKIPETKLRFYTVVDDNTILERLEEILEEYRELKQKNPNTAFFQVRAGNGEWVQVLHYRETDILKITDIEDRKHTRVKRRWS